MGLKIKLLRGQNAPSASVLKIKWIYECWMPLELIVLAYFLCGC